LEKRLTEPLGWPPGSQWERFKSWVAWKAVQLRSKGTIPPLPMPQYNRDFRSARNMAAGLTVLALGTNGGGGVVRLLETAASYTPVAGNYADHGLLETFTVAAELPERRGEIVAGLTEALNHTNVFCRFQAAGLVRLYWKDSPEWRGKLLTLARKDPVSVVRREALWSLIVVDAKNEEITLLCAENLRNSGSSWDLRRFAAAGLGRAEEKGVPFLPLLWETLADPDRNIQTEVRRAIERIEKAVRTNSAGNSK
jgi:hypothetical protein